MSVSSVDPPSTQKSPRPLELLHELELACNSAAEATRALEVLGQKLALCATEALSRLVVPESQRLNLALGSATPTNVFVGESLIADARALTATYDRLASNYEPALRELATQGLQALRNAAVYTGRERQEELHDGLRLLKDITQTPIGSRNFAVWFELGWAQWMQGEAPEIVVESFYHAVRLSGHSGDTYLRHALRHLAYQQADQGKWADAWTTIQRALDKADETSPALWIEAARYALGAGDPTGAQELLDRALDFHPESLLVIFADPDLAPLFGTCSRTIEKFAQAAREVATKELERLRSARDADQLIRDKLGLQLDFPAPLIQPESLQKSSLFKAHKLAEEAHQEASAIFEIAISAVKTEQKTASDNARRIKIQIDQAVSEQSYYQGSLHNIEEHARESGFSLHPYTFNNPFFRKRNQKAEDARFAYESFKQKLAETESFLENHLPAMEQVYDRHEKRRLQVEEVLNWLFEKQQS